MLLKRTRGAVVIEALTTWMGAAILGATFFTLADAGADAAGNLSLDVAIRALERLGSLGIVAWLVWHNNAKREPAQVAAAAAQRKDNDTLIKDVVTQFTTALTAERLSREKAEERAAANEARDQKLRTELNTTLTRLAAVVELKMGAPCEEE